MAQEQLGKHAQKRQKQEKHPCFNEEINPSSNMTFLLS
jgi:hypothetical protein